MNDTPAGLLEGLEVLLATARGGSATRAARALGTTPATVLRRLAGLEAAIGARLFDRTPGGLAATPALELVLPWAEQASAAAARMKDQVAGLEREPVGEVRLALVPGLSSLVVAPALPALLARHPGLTVELLPGSAVVDLARREADLALRIIRPESGDLVVQRVATYRLAVMAAPALLRGRRRPRPAELPWLTFGPELAGTPEAAWLRAHAPGARVALRSNDLQTLVAAARAGAGALLLAEELGRAAGGLVPLPTGLEMPEAALWLVAHRALRPVPRVAAVWEWLVELFSAASSGRRASGAARGPGRPGPRRRGSPRAGSTSAAGRRPP